VEQPLDRSILLPVLARRLSIALACRSALASSAVTRCARVRPPPRSSANALNANAPITRLASTTNDAIVLCI